MVLILSLETSTAICSVALHQGERLVSLQEVAEPGAHSSRLMDLISKCLSTGGVKLHDLDAIAVSAGPGSYTGLRIGISAAKGLAYALNKPIIGVGSMELLAHAAQYEISDPGLIIPMLDARRMEVYAQIFDEELKSVEPVQPVVLNESSFENYLIKSPVYFIGDGVDKAQEIISHPNARFLNLAISAKFMGAVAIKRFEKEEFENLAYFTPDYLKEFKVLKSKKNPLLK